MTTPNTYSAELPKPESGMSSIGRLWQRLIKPADSIKGSEVELRALFEAMSDVILVLDAEGRCLRIAPTNSLLSRQSTDRLLGQKVHEILAPAQGDIFLHWIQRVLKTRQAINGEFRLDIDGKETWFAATISPLLEDTVILVARDITERKQAEEALARERNLLRTLIDNLPEYVYVKDTAGRYLISNKTHIRFLGATKLDEVVGKTAFDLFSKELAAQYDADDQTVIKSGQRVINREEPTVDRDGNKRWNSTTKVPLQDGQGKIVGLIGLSRDVTERKQAEQEILQSNQELSALNEIGRTLSKLAEPSEIFELVYAMVGRVLDNSNSYIGLYNEANQQLTFPIFTKNGQRLEPYTRPFANSITEYVIRTKGPLLIPCDLERTVAKLDIQLQYKTPPPKSLLGVPMIAGEKVFGVIMLQDYDHEYAYTTKHVELLSTFAAQAAVTIENARLFATLQQELVERKQAEEALVRRTAELEQAYRSLQENQEKLLTAERMASLGRLTAGIAHEMNTPLAALRAALVELKKLVEEYQSSIGGSEVTLDDHTEIAKEMQQAIRLVDTSAERAASFVRGIKTQTRDLSRHERQRFNAVPVIQEVLLLVGHALRKQNCTATFEPAVNYVELSGSPGRLAQVITNLVTNAIDASVPKGGSPITLRLTPRGSEVVLEVSDLGCGIPPENRSRIFDPMFTTKPFGEGTGLGLTIVYDIVHGEFGGTIEVASEVGQGTTFTLRFSNPREGV